MNNEPRRGGKIAVPRSTQRQIVDLHFKDKSLPIVDSRGRVTIPPEVPSALGLRTGNRVDFVEIEKGQFTIVAANKSVQELDGLFKRSRKRTVTLEEMNAAIARGAATSK